MRAPRVVMAVLHLVDRFEARGIYVPGEDNKTLSPWRDFGWLECHVVRDRRDQLLPVGRGRERLGRDVLDDRQPGDESADEARVLQLRRGLARLVSPERPARRN